MDGDSECALRRNRRQLAGGFGGGMGGDQIKVGSITRSERLAKYNRLLEIEAEAHYPIERWPNV